MVSGNASVYFAPTFTGYQLKPFKLIPKRTFSSNCPRRDLNTKGVKYQLSWHSNIAVHQALEDTKNHLLK